MISDLIVQEIKVQQARIEEAQLKLGQLQRLSDDCSVLASFVQRIKENLDVLSLDAIAHLKTSIVSLLDGDDNRPTDPDNDPDGGDDTPPRGDNDGNGDVGEVEQPYDPEETIEDIGFTATPQPETQYTELVHLSDRVAYLKVATSSEVLAAYVGLPTKTLARSWARYLQPMAFKVIEIREPKRLQASKEIRQELKLVGLGMNRINQLIGRDFSKFPPKLDPKKTPPARPTIEVGDIVQSELVADWTYEVLAIKDDQLEVKRVGMPAAPVETRSNWSVVLVGKKKPAVNLHTFTLKERQIEQLGAIALMIASLGYDVQDGETCAATPNWVVLKGFKKLGDLYYLAGEWQLESQNPELQMDSDSFVEMLVDWGVLTETEARHEVA